MKTPERGPSLDRQGSEKRRLIPWAVAGLLLVGIVAVYWQTTGFGFLAYDDALFITNSPIVRQGLTAESVRWALTNGPVGEWYPLSMLSHMLDCQVYGQNAGGHHLTSLLLHAATSIALFLVLSRMTDQRTVPEVAQVSGGRVAQAGPSADNTLARRACLRDFCLHPQHVESVAWIAERRDVLSGLFFVLILAAYLSYVRHPLSLARYRLVALLLGLGLMSKAMLVTVPALLLLLDYWPLGRFGQAADLPRLR